MCYDFATWVCWLVSMGSWISTWTGVWVSSSGKALFGLGIIHSFN